MSTNVRGHQRTAIGLEVEHFTAQLIFWTSFFKFYSLLFSQGMSLKYVILLKVRSSFREGRLNQSNNLLIGLSDTKILNTHSDRGELPFLVISVKSLQLIGRGQVIHPLGKLFRSLMASECQTEPPSPTCSRLCVCVCEKRKKCNVSENPLCIFLVGQQSDVLFRPSLQVAMAHR